MAPAVLVKHVSASPGPVARRDDEKLKLLRILRNKRS